jgi:hypothetical protein
MGFGFGFAGLSAVLPDQGVAGKGIESLLVAATASLGEAVGGHLRGKVSE